MKNKFKLLLVFVLLLVICTACSNDSKTDDAENNNKKNNEGYEVSEILLYDKNNEYNGKITFKYNSKEHITRQTKYDKTDKIIDDYTTTFTYLDDGRISSKLLEGYSYIGSVNGKKYDIYEYHIYNWDDSGKIAYVTKNYKEYMGDTETQVYDNKGRIIEETYGSYTDYYTYKKNEHIRKTYYAMDNETTYYVKKYDDNENVIKEENYTVSGTNNYKKEDLVDYTVYEYKNKDKLDYVAKSYSSSDELLNYTIAKYDDNKIDYRYERYDKNGNLLMAYKYIYKPIEELIEER